MRGSSRTAILARWFCTLTCVTLLVAFVFSTRRAVHWTHPDLKHGASLLAGAIFYGWRPAARLSEQDPYPPRPRWAVIRCNGTPELEWRPHLYQMRPWKVLLVPLWMPFAALAPLTSILWYRDRRSVASRVRRIMVRMAPKCCKQVTFRLVIVFCFVHAALDIGYWKFARALFYFFVDYQIGDPVPAFVNDVPLYLFLSTPLWAVLWAWLYTRLLNRLAKVRPSHSCWECGYDLTGLPEPRCPECGTPFTPSPAC